MESSERQRINLRLYAEGTTTDAEVYRYLIFNRRWNQKQGKAMIAQAVRDYWLADARQCADSRLAKTTAIASIERLEHRISQLRQEHGLELPIQSSSEQPELIELLIQLISEVRLTSQSLTDEVKLASQSLTSIASSLAAGKVNLQPSLEAPSPAASPVAQNQNIFADDITASLLDIVNSLEE